MEFIAIYDYLSYRDFLRSYYEARKKVEPFFSYRYIAQKVGMDHSLLIKIFLGKRHIANDAIAHFIKFCKLSRNEAQYFETLVHYEKARSEKQSRVFFEKLLALRGYRSARIEKYRYEYFQKWYYPAVRALIDCIDFRGDFQALARTLNPQITVSEAKSAIELLEQLAFIRRDATGRYHLTDAHVTTGEQWEALAIRQHQRQTIMMSAESLERDPKNTRDISSLTMSIDADAFEDIRAIIAECRAAIIRRVDQIPDQTQDRVYQLNMQLIPLSRTLSHEH